MREDAIARIKNSLVISKIAVEEKIRVQQKDIEEKIRLLAQTYGTSAKEVIEHVQKNPMIINSLSQQALSEKITKLMDDRVLTKSNHWLIMIGNCSTIRSNHFT